MIDRVRISTLAADLAQELNSRFPELRMGRIYRLAALLSLRRNGWLESAPERVDSDTSRPCRVSEIFEIIHDGRPVLFPTITSILAGRDLEEEEVYQQVWWHIHLGMPDLERLAQGCSGTDDLMERVVEESGLDPQKLSVPEVAPQSGAHEVCVGKDRHGQDVPWYINDSRQVEAPHAAIVGLTGQGKTQFALDVLLQIAEHEPEITFTILDYKGDLSEPGSAAFQALTETLQAELVNVAQQPIPVVPFKSRAGVNPEQIALMKAELFGKLHSQIGTQQRQTLRRALTDLLEKDLASSSPGFGFAKLDEHLEQLYELDERRPDGLVEVASRLRILRPFLEVGDGRDSLLSRRLLIRLNELPTDNLPIAFLLIDRVYEEMKLLPDAPRRGSIVSLQHVIFVDEAHHYLQVRASPLTSIIREGRSKGVAVLLATQTVSDLAGASGADYREHLGTVFFFKTNITSTHQIRAMVPARTSIARDFADQLAELGVGEMLSTRHLRPEGPAESVIDAVQFFERSR